MAGDEGEQPEAVGRADGDATDVLADEKDANPPIFSHKYIL